MRILVDTGLAINSGHKHYHLWVMSQCPEMIAEYLQCGKDTNYDVVQFISALDPHVSSQLNTQGQMTDIIRYHTPYLVNDMEPLIISFSLGDEIFLRTVSVLLTHLSMGVTIDLQCGTLSCSQLSFYFDLFLDPPGKGLYDGISLDNTTSIFTPPGVTSNVSSRI